MESTKAMAEKYLRAEWKGPSGIGPGERSETRTMITVVAFKSGMVFNHCHSKLHKTSTFVVQIQPNNTIRHEARSDVP